MKMTGLKSLIKHLVKDWLARKGYFIFFVPEKAPTGVSLECDLLRFMNTGEPVILDVGANVGQTIDLILGKLPGAKIIAFEPSSKICQQLRRTHGSLCWQIWNLALSDQDGTRIFTNYENSVFSSLLKLKPSDEHRLPEIHEAEEEAVAVRRLDGLASELGVGEIDLLKIDTQGNDLRVLHGAEALFRAGRVKRVLVELNFFQMYENEGDAIAIMSFLKSHGLHLVELYEKSRNGRVITWCTGLFERGPKKESQS